MTEKKYDLIVIGSGPSGHHAAIQAAKAGFKALVIEKQVLGGGCIYSGTIPSKSLRESVYRWSMGSKGTMGREQEHYSDITDLPDFPDMSRLLRRKNRVVQEGSEIFEAQLKRNHVDFLMGEAQILSPHSVKVVQSSGDQVVHGSHLVIATGSSPVQHPHLPVDGELVVDSDTVFDLKKVPKRMVVLGAGVIGSEYAAMFLMAGTQVTLIDRHQRVLDFVDREIVSHLLERFDHYGLELKLETECEKVEVRKTKKGSVVDVFLNDGTVLETDVVLVALGRKGNVEGLGLENIGLKPTDRGLIEVEKSYETSVPGVYAVGDVIGFPALASTSKEQGRVATCHALGLDDACSKSKNYPYGIYTIPEISTIGLTEEQAIAEGKDFVIGRAPYKELARGQIVGDQWGMLKLVVEKGSLKILGVHIIGESAADIIGIGQAVMDLGGDVNYFVGTVFNYPTWAEAYKAAALHAMNCYLGRHDSEN